MATRTTTRAVRRERLERVPPWSACAYLRLAAVNRGYGRLSDDARYAVRLFAVRADEGGRIRFRPSRLPCDARRWIGELVRAGWLRVLSTRGGLRVVRLTLPRGEPRERLED